MPMSFFVSRQARIGDVAALVGTTPRAIRHYHDMGLIREPRRGGDGRRRYGSEIRAESDRLDAAEEALDDTVAVDDPRVAETAAQRHAFEEILMTVIEESGVAEEEAALLDALDIAHPDGTLEPDAKDGGMSAFEAVTKLPHDFSPARVRCAELAQELATRS
ncbi:MerR family DNA-binding transcriptional regulator [Streptomyces goshikiensis]|uniref:MerR family transcriptional regulator n=1 Tax=Streptomyces goshikiensis TaxID=1942 RepID=UPI0037D610F5